jgi:streptogramin lyase
MEKLGIFKKQKTETRYKLSVSAIITSLVLFGLVLSVFSYFDDGTYLDINNSYQFVQTAQAEGVVVAGDAEVGFFTGIWNWINSLFGNSDNLKGDLLSSEEPGPGFPVGAWGDIEAIESKYINQAGAWTPKIDISFTANPNTVGNTSIYRQRYYDSAYDQQMPSGCLTACWLDDTSFTPIPVSSSDTFKEDKSPSPTDLRKYRYQIRGSVNTGSGSQPVSSPFTSTVIRKLWPPDSVQAFNGSVNNILLNWMMVSNSSVSGYKLEVYDSSNTLLQLASQGLINSTSQSLSLNLSNHVGEQLKFRIKSAGDISPGEKGFTNAYAEISRYVGLYPPGNIDAKVMRDGDVLVVWDMIQNATFNVSQDGVSSAAFMNADSTTFPNPSVGIHHYSITTKMGQEQSVASEPVYVEKLSAPTISSVYAVGSSIEINWDNQDPSDTYELFRDGTSEASGLSTSSIIDTVPLLDQPYQYSVRRFGAVGNSASAESDKVEVVPLNIPDMVSITAVADSATLSWSYPGDSGNVHNFDIYVKINTGVYILVYNHPNNIGGLLDASYGITGISVIPGDTYQFKIVAKNTNAESLAIESEELRPIGPATNLIATANGGQVTLGWIYPGLLADVEKYEIGYLTTDENGSILASGSFIQNNTISSGQNIPGLFTTSANLGTKNTYTITAINESFNSRSETISSNELVTLNEPINLEVSLDGNTSTISWDDNQNILNSIDSFNIHKNGVFISSTLGNMHSHEDTISSGQQFAYQVYASNEYAISEGSASSSSVAVIQPVSNVYAVANDNVITVGWDPPVLVQNINEYQVSLSSIFSTPLSVPVGISSVTFTVNNFETNHQYYVRAKNNSYGVSELIGPTDIVIPLFTPENLTVASQGLATTLTFEYPSSGDKVDEFEIFRSVSGSTGLTSYSTISAGVIFDNYIYSGLDIVGAIYKFEDTNITPGAAYVYAVKAHNDNATSGVSAETPPHNVLIAPEISDISGIGKNITLKISDQGNGINVNSYEIVIFGDSVIAFSPYVVSKDNDPTVVPIMNLLYGVAYTFKVKAMSDISDSVYSVLTAPIILVDSVQNVDYSVSADLVTLSWDNPSQFFGVTGYQIAEGTGANSYSLPYGTNSISFNLPQTGTIYNYTIKTIGTNTESNPVSKNIFSLATPQVIGVDAEGGVISLSWSHNNNVGLIDSYAIYVDDGSGEVLVSTIEPNNYGTDNLLIDSRDLDVTYSYFVKASNGSVSSGPAYFAEVHTLKSPINVQVGVMGNSLTLSWGYDGDGSKVDYFEIHKTNTINAISTIHTHSGVPSLGVYEYSDFIDPNITYTYKIKAFNVNARSSFSEVVSADVLVAPTNVSASASGDDIIIEWEDSNIPSKVTHYELFENNQFIDLIQSNSDMIYLRSDVSFGSSYSYQIRARHQSNNVSSTFSASSNLVTPLSVPNIDSVSSVGSQVSIAFTHADSVNTMAYELWRAEGSSGLSFDQVGVYDQFSISNGIITDSIGFNNSYQYRLKAVNDYSESFYSNYSNSIIALPGVEDFVAVADGNTITLEWGYLPQPSGFLEAFQIYRNANPIPIAMLDSAQLSELKYTDPNRNLNTSYSYKIIASNQTYDAKSVITESNLVTPISSPLITDLYSNGSSGISLTLQNGLNINSYEIWRSDNGVDQGSIDLFPISTIGYTSYLDETTTPGVSYSYKIKSVNDYAKSVFSGVTPNVIPLSEPTNVIPYANGQSINITWSISNGGAGVSYYKLFRNGEPLSVLSGANVSSYTDTGVNIGSAYYYNIQTLNTRAESTITMNSPSVVPLMSPIIANANSTGALIEFDIQGGNGINVESYLIYQSVNGGGYTLYDEIEASYGDPQITAYSTSVGASGDSFTFKVKAVNSHAESLFSNSSGEINQLSTPNNIRVSADGGVATVSWDYSGNLIVLDSFNIYQSVDGGSYELVKNTNAIVGNDSVTGLIAESSYQFKVQAKNTSSVSILSEPSAVLIPLAMPVSINIGAVANTINVNVSYPAGVSANSVIIERKIPGGDFTAISVLGVGSAGEVNTEHTGLYNKTYTYRAKLINEHASSLYKTFVDQIELVQGVLNVGGSVQGASFTLDWQYPGDSSEVDEYQIMRAVDGNGYIVASTIPNALIGVNSPEYEYREGVVLGSVYTYYIVAKNNYAISNSSTNVSFSPLAPPENILAQALGTTATLNWSDSNSPTNVTHYEIYRDNGINQTFLSQIGSATNTYLDQGNQFGGITVGSIYSYQLIAKKGIVSSDYSLSSNQIKPILAPAVSVDLPGGSAIELTIGNGLYVNSFIIERAVGALGFNALSTVSVTPTSPSTIFNDSGNYGQQYKYRVKAINDYAESVFSNETAPVGLVATPQSIIARAVDKSVTLSWMYPGNGMDVSSYSILRKTEQGADFAPIGVMANTLYGSNPNYSYLDETVAYENKYYYRIIALNNDAISNQSSSSNLVSPIRPLTQLDFTISGDDAQITWIYPGNGQFVTSYRVERVVNNGVPSLVKEVFENLTPSYNQEFSEYDDLVLGNEYSYRIKLGNEYAESVMSNTLYSLSPMLAPTDISAFGFVENGNYRIDVAWVPPSTSILSDVDVYVIYRNGLQLDIVGKTQQDYLDVSAGLTLGSNYSYQVATFSQNYQVLSFLSSESNEVTLLDAPEIIDVYIQNSDELVVEFIDNNNGVNATAYNVYRKAGSGLFSSIPIGSVGFSQLNNNEGIFIDSTAVIGTEYAYKIKAINDFSESDFSDESDVGVIPEPPGTVTASGYGNTIEVEWVPGEFGQYLTAYKIFENGIEVGSVSATSYFYSRTGLALGTTYSYQIYSMDGTNIVNSSDPTEPVTLLYPPSIEDIEADGTTVSFNIVDTANGQFVQSYAIYRVDNSVEPQTPIDIISASSIGNGAIEYVDYDLEIGHSYKYYVQAINSFAFSDYSDMSDEVTILDIPEIAEITFDHTIITIEWSYGGDESKVEEFEIWRSSNGNGANSNFEIAFKEVSNLSGGVQSFIDTDVKSMSSIYSYKIRAVNHNSKSVKSEPSEEIILLYPPENVRANAEGNKVIVKWDDTNNNLNNFDTYEVFQNDIFLFTLDNQYKSFIQSNLSIGSTYRYEIRAKKGDSMSNKAESNYVNLIGSPLNPSVSSNGSEVLVEWLAPANTTNIEGYHVVYQNETFWIGNEGGVSRVINGSVMERYDLVDDVTAVVTDFDDNMWFSTYGSGVFKYDGYDFEQFDTSKGLISDDVNDILMDNNGNLWFATEAGVSKYDGLNWQSFGSSNLVNIQVNDIYQDNNGNLWFATDGGISVYNGSSWSSITVNNTQGQLLSNTVYEIMQNSENKLFIATNAGVSILTITVGGAYSWANYTSAGTGIVDDDIRTVEEDSSGDMWFGTYDSGISVRKQAGNWVTYNSLNTTELGNDNITDLMLDTYNRIWIATDGGGVTVYDGASWYSINEGDDLMDDNTFYIYGNDELAPVIDSTLFGDNDLSFDIANLGYAYSFTVLSYNEFAVSDHTGIVSVIPLSIPSLSGTPGFQQNLLNWDAPVGGESYTLYMKTGSGSAFSSIYSGSATEYLHSGLSIQGESYLYKVKASNTTGAVSEFSNTVTLMPEVFSGIKGVIFYDYDGNEAYSSTLNDQLIEEALVTLYDDQGLVISSTYSDVSGYYEFDPINTGDYYVSVNTKKLDAMSNPLIDINNMYTIKPQNATSVSFNSITNPEHILNLGLSSLNTDRQGIWNDDMAIGLGDISKIISLGHWQQATSGTSFNYLDLTYDEFIDLSDLSKILNEDYWEFPYN